MEKKWEEVKKLTNKIENNVEQFLLKTFKLLLQTFLITQQVCKILPKKKKNTSTILEIYYLDPMVFFYESKPNPDGKSYRIVMGKDKFEKNSLLV